MAFLPFTNFPFRNPKSHRNMANEVSPLDWILILFDCGIFHQGDPSDWPSTSPSTSNEALANTIAEFYRKNCLEGQ